MKLAKIRLDIAVIAAYSALELVFTWPLALRLTTHVIGFPNDNFEYIWKLWWTAHAVFERGVSPFVQPDIYYPFGYLLAYGDITPAHTFLLMPVTLLLGATTTYNLIMLVSGPLSGWAMFRLARRWLARSGDGGEGALAAWAAFFAGAVFALSAYRLFRTIGHLPLIDTHWLVIAVWGLDRWIESRRLRDALLAAIGISMAALGSWYYALMLLILLPVMLIAWVGDLRPLLQDRRTWVSAAVVAGVTAALCVPFMLPYREVGAQAGGALIVPLDDASFWAASPLDYLLPNPRHPLWGAAIQRAMWPLPGDPPGEFGAATLGLTTLLFAAWGWKRASGPRWRAIKWVGGVALILSFGPILHVGRLPLGIPLPAMLLRLLPLADSVRSWGRFSIFVMLVASLLAAAGFRAGLADIASHKRQMIAAALVTALALFESYSTLDQLYEVGPRPVDAWLAAQPGDFAIMQYPLGEALSGRQMLYTRYHGKKITFGYGTYLPLIYLKRHPELAAFPADAALDRLVEWRVRYVLVGSRFAAEPIPQAAIDAQPRLKRIGEWDGIDVYELAR